MKITLSNQEIVALKDLLDPRNINALKGVDKRTLSDIYQRLSGKSVVKLFVDGAANLQENTAGIGGVFYRNGDEMYSFSENIGSKTNNEAEYGALIKGIAEALKLKLTSLAIYADSELVVKQINGLYKVKNERMQVLHRKATGLLSQLQSWTLEHIPREQNDAADKLSKQGMSAKK